MAGKHPYPAAEHYVEPTTPAAVLTEEMRLYPEPSDFRRGILTIEKYYHKSLLFDCFRKYAFLNVKASVLTTGREVQTGPACLAFYSGEILVAHSMLKPLRAKYRQHILKADFFPKYARGLDDFDSDDEALAPFVDELVELRDDLANNLYMDHSEEYHTKVLEVVTHHYGDLPGASFAEDLFVSGFLHGEDLIHRALANSHEIQSDIPV